MNLNDQQLVAAAFEGALDETSFRRLQDRLANEPGLLALYREHALLHHSLCEEYEGSGMVAGAVSAGPRVPRWAPMLAACAAAVAMAFAAWQWMKPSRHSQATAGCAFSPDAIALVDGRQVLNGSGFSIGSRLSVERGWVRLNLPRRAVALIEAPASVVYEGDQTLRVENGRARFQCPASAKGFTVHATSLSAVDHGTDFGVVSRPGAADELHVFTGEVEVKAVTGTAAARLHAMEAAAVDGDGAMRRMAAREEDFESLTPEVKVLLEDRFDNDAPLDGRHPAVGKSAWRLEKGTARMMNGQLEGTAFEAYFWLPSDGLSASRPVLLVTVETAASPSFHTAEWAGFSLYQDGYEHCFFGDSFGPEETWSLDVKRRFVPVLPSTFVTGPRTMTLRYDRRTGIVELHEGASAGDKPIIRSKLQPGLSFDQIRIGAGEGATLTVKKLSVRAIHEPPLR